MTSDLESLSPLYERLLTDFGHAAQAGKLRCSQVYLQPSLVAPHYDGELLYVGRSANAWEQEYDPQQWTEASGRDSALRDIRRQMLDGLKDLNGFSWVPLSGNRFWSVGKAIAESAHLVPFEDDWRQRFAFTNLYKITDSDTKRGTPRDSTQNAQWHAAQSLFEAELTTLAPRVCIMNVGYAGYAKYFPGGHPDSWRETFVAPGSGYDLISAVGRHRDTNTLMIITERTDAQVANRTTARSVAAIEQVLKKYL